MNLMLTDITNSIAAISVSGVTIKDVDELSGSWLGNANILFPNPDNFISGFGIEYDALMQGSTAPMTVSYTLSYRLLSVQIGDISAFPVSYSQLVDKVASIVDAFVSVFAPYSGRVEMIVSGVSLGPRQDPAGNNFFGADIALAIREMHN